MNPALFAAIIAANIVNNQSPQYPYVERPWWAEKSKLPCWPSFLLWLIRRRTQRRLAGRTWIKLDDWLWDKYFAAIEKPAAANDNDGVRDEVA